jgi:hypothetical protein
VLTVKVSTAARDWPWLRQTPGGNGVWGNCRFIVDEPVESCDFWVVYDGLLEPETTSCPPGATLLVTGEPPSVKLYRPGFVAQFGAVRTCHRQIVHPHVTLGQPALPWHVGRRQQAHQNLAFTWDYDALKGVSSFPKSRLISVISSDKVQTAGHRRRLKFVQRLKQHFGDQLDVFGRGIREVEDKWDAIAPYRYHVALENGVYPDYWTEKLSDTFLAGAFPLYLGCPNVNEYFPADSLTTLDANDSTRAIAAIEEAMGNNRFEHAASAMAEARQLVLDQYNLFPLLADMLATSPPTGDRVPTAIRPEGEFPRRSKLRRILQRWREGPG